MRPDLKIGMLTGVALAIGATLVISTRPNSSIENRLRKISVRNHTDVDNQSGPDKDVEPGEKRIDYDEQLLQQMLGRAEEAMRQDRQDDTSGDNIDNSGRRIHTVLEGETLTHISNLYYGSSAYWQRIAEANSRTITDPDRLAPGMRLVIPE